MTQFNSLKTLYGEDNFNKLTKAKVCIIGIGGVGSWAAESLVRSGVANITLIDLDDVCKTNINRQAQAFFSTVGMSKIDALTEKLLDINPKLQVNKIYDYISEDNLYLLDNNFDVVIDCIDKAHIKAALIAYCKSRKIKVITTGGAGGKVDATKVKIVDLAKTENDILASKVKYKLRKYYNFPKTRFRVPCVYSTDSPIINKDINNCSLSNCDFVYGSSVVITATFGLVAAQACIETIFKRNKL